MKDLIKRWTFTPAKWWQFWMPQSGLRGGLIIWIICFIVWILILKK